MGKTTDSKQEKIKHIIVWIMLCFALLLLALLFVLFVVFVLVVFSDGMFEWIRERLGTTESKTETLWLIGVVISGVAALAFASIKLLTKLQTRVADISSLKDNELVKKEHPQEHFKVATEHLGNENASVRIAAFYEFLHLIRDNGDEYRKSILDILYAHIRTTTTNPAYGKEAQERGESIKPTEEIQGLLNILFKSQDIDRSDIELNLQRVDFSGADLVNGDLSGADLREAKLLGANLSESDLSSANLRKADLSGADLSKANLSGAILSGADLSKVKLLDANLSKVDLSEAKLLGANLYGANLVEANLSRANLVKADLPKVNLIRADLFQAKLSKATFPEADLSGADLFKADLSGAFLFKANLVKADLCEANLSGADLSEANLSEARLGEASYTHKTIFPEWFVLPITPPDNGDKVQFRKGFIAPEKPEEGK